MATINSVLGEIDSKDLGFTLMHEHVMVAASGLSTPLPRSTRTQPRTTCH